ncbi:ATP-binding protein [Thermosynechococcaceae cyanobacterium BACA0444]|uniref:histidine kinase n=1 Tax=Pseudocalidococcus azoricus BACA0444 TaxID=2918990 RepID=A0AAE4FTM3_9CYAN|nr:ATP-binding protein [Pseudocalidococcus azoricus]MDS3860751.1 ATP-binding protein [Pseudocalidococcus azoricus BACA0444]
MADQHWQKSHKILSILASLSCRTKDLRNYLEAVAYGVSELLMMDWTVVTLCKENEEQLIASNLPLDPEDRVCDLHGTVTHTVVLTRQPLCVNDVREQPEFGELPEGYLSYLGVPLCTLEGEVMGTICSFNMQPRPFHPTEVETVKLFAERAATAIDNYLLYQAQQDFNQRLTEEVEKRTADLQQAQHQLVEQARLAAIGEFATMIVHELRNPLTTIKMGLNYFFKLALPAAAQERLTLALEEAHRLEMLLSEILLYAKPQTLNKSRFDLNFLGLEIQHILEDLPEAQGRAIMWQTGPQPVWIKGDRDKLKQVFFNVIQNACEAAPAHTPITCTIQVNNPAHRFNQQNLQQVTVTIQNWGEPIPATEIPKLTQPFYSRKPGGTGLGLAIVERILAAHQGRLEIYSNQDEGTRVLIQLKVEMDESG